MVICLERGADLHMAELMPLPLTVSCFSKIQIGFTFLVPAHLGSPGKRAVKRVCVCGFITGKIWDKTDTPCGGLALYPWPCSISWILAEGYRNEHQHHPRVLRRALRLYKWHFSD